MWYLGIGVNGDSDVVTFDTSSEIPACHCGHLQSDHLLGLGVCISCHRCNSYRIAK